MLTLEVKLRKDDPEGKIGELRKLLEGNCNMRLLLPNNLIIIFHMHVSNC